MNLAARLGTLAGALALIACGGASHTHDGGSEDVDGGAVHDGGSVNEDAATSSDGGLVEGSCTGDEAWPTGAGFGVGELAGLGEGPWTATIVAVSPTGVDLAFAGRSERFAWPANSGLEGLSVGMEVQLSLGFRRSVLRVPDFTLHAVYAAHIGAPPHEVFTMPIEADGAPPMSLTADCTFVYPDGDPCGGPALATAYTLAVADEQLRAGESAAGPGYAIYFDGAATYPGNHGVGGCILEAAYSASLGVRVDHAVEPESCESIEARYAQVVDEKASCAQPTDCRITSGHCGVGLGGCWYAVSGDVSELDALAVRYSDLGCTSAVCRCAPPPESASCVAGRCMAD